MTAPRRRHGLIVLNAGLLVLLAAVTLASSAGAQRAGGRAPGDYTMVSGKIQGGTGHAVFIVDVANQEMIAVRWNNGTKSLDGIGYRDLSLDAQMNPGR
jgi:hypothetical protein